MYKLRSKVFCLLRNIFFVRISIFGFGFVANNSNFNILISLKVIWGDNHGQLILPTIADST